jgi:hypothetical protein
MFIMSSISTITSLSIAATTHPSSSTKIQRKIIIAMELYWDQINIINLRKSELTKTYIFAMIYQLLFMIMIFNL